MDRLGHGKIARQYEEDKYEDDRQDSEDDLLFNEEVSQMKASMQEKFTSRTQDVMGESHGIKKIHTREMSRIFRSKKEIYQILLIEGQYYLPPFEECTIDYLRDIFSGRKKVSVPAFAEPTIIHSYSTCSTAM